MTYIYRFDPRPTLSLPFGKTLQRQPSTPAGPAAKLSTAQLKQIVADMVG